MSYTRGRRGVRPLSYWLLASLLVPLATVALPQSAQALPSGFADSQTAIGGGALSGPTNFAFAPDGRVFVNEWAGVVKVFDGVTDSTPTVVLDIRDEVFSREDSGLNGLTLDPEFPTRPYLYISYQYDAPPGGTAPTYHDTCSTTSGCPTVGRVDRLTLSGSRVTERRQLLADSCNALGPHAIDDVQFGPAGVAGGLYVGIGDGATSGFTDYGQTRNPCDDPPGGTDLQAATSHGGAFHSQDAETDADPLGLSGSLVRIHPDTGAPMPGNPFADHPDPNKRKVLAYGLRNPFRFTFRPGTSELYVGDVGWNTYEELNLVDTAATTARNFGWPCYEGAPRQASYDNLNNVNCDGTATTPGLYGKGTAVTPYWSYQHAGQFLPSGACPAVDAGAIGGMRFYTGPNATMFPAAYRGAFFFSDYARGCILLMRPKANGQPDPATLTEFAVVDGTSQKAAEGVVDLEIGPDGALYTLNYYTGRIYRIAYSGGSGGTDQAPVASATATPPSGPVGTTVAFDASASRDPEGGTLTYSWDLDGNGTFGDATGVRTSRTYGSAGRIGAAVRVTDPSGLTATASVPVTIGQPPTVRIDIAPGSQTWTTGEALSLSGSATDATGQPVPATSLSWSVLLQHCEIVKGAETCHGHPETTGTGSRLSLTGPDHSYPSYLSATLTATDSAGITGSSTVRLDPVTSTLTLASRPSGLSLGLDGEVVATPTTRTLIVGSRHSVSAADQTFGGTGHTFARWSDAGAANHDLVATAAPTTLTASFTATTPPTQPPGQAGPADISTFCAAAPPTSGFTDAGTVFAEEIACLRATGIATGVTASRYAPYRPVTRAEMASFVVRLVDTAVRLQTEDLNALPDAPGAGAFADVSARSAHHEAVNRLAQAGIVRGGPGGRPAHEYGPDLPVTRAQVATMLTGAHAWLTGGATAAPGTGFTDLGGLGPQLQADIRALAAAGVTGGVTADRYAPFDPVTRGQMAAFVTRLLAVLQANGLVEPLPAGESRAATVPVSGRETT